MIRELEEFELSTVTGGIYSGGSTGGDDGGVGIAINLSNVKALSLHNNLLSDGNSGDVGGDDGVGQL